MLCEYQRANQYEMQSQLVRWFDCFAQWFLSRFSFETLRNPKWYQIHSMKNEKWPLYDDELRNFRGQRPVSMNGRATRATSNNLINWWRTQRFLSPAFGSHELCTIGSAHKFTDVTWFRNIFFFISSPTSLNKLLSFWLSFRSLWSVYWNSILRFTKLPLTGSSHKLKIIIYFQIGVELHGNRRH